MSEAAPLPVGKLADRMADILRYEEFLGLLERISESAPPDTDPTVEALPATDADEEADEWMALLLGANVYAWDEAKLRTCRSGLGAIARYIAERDGA